MRLTAARLLNVLPGAVVISSMVTLAVMPANAAAASGAVAPAPYVIAIDAGHGGSPDDAQPNRLFDPGSVAGNGLVEKDLTLNVAKRIERQLKADQVKVVMTRSSDQFVGIETRMATANQAHAQLFVSVHFNFFQDPSIGGSLILYPRDSDRPFAQVMSDTLAKRLARFDIANDGVTKRDNLWTHATMPAVTVEGAYLTNRSDAEQLTRDNVREAIASGVTAGIEAQLPDVQARKAEILRYQQLSARAAAAHRIGPIPAPSLPHGIPVMQLAVVAAACYLLIRYRRATIPVIAFGAALASVAHSKAAGRGPQQRTRRGVRRRRSRAPLWSDIRTY
ncbi:MAG TPA: N-acetylmuramoyl-L-alanine amidase [Candidatus Dormibacteraeota bacterium]